MSKPRHGRLPGRPLPLIAIALLGIAVAEFVGLGLIWSRVPDDSDWVAAASFVLEEHADGDLIASVPHWTGPVARNHLGDKMTAAEAGYSSLAGYRRFWVFSIRGHDSADAPDRPPDLQRQFGRVTVRRWDLSPSGRVFAPVEAFEDSTVELVAGGEARECQPRTGPATAGGLGAGPSQPRASRNCDPGRPHLWVGPTVIQDFAMRPRYCIRVHPQGMEPIRIRYRDVPLGERLVLFGGLPYVYERARKADVYAVVRVDGEIVGRMVHHDGDGWKRMEVETRSGEDARESPDAKGEIAFEFTTPNPELRHFCWFAEVFGDAGPEAAE
ncbi:MAG: hypothetical protein AAGF12_13145 [Myxococcota bacterium]